MNTKTIAFFNNAGGVGKSTLIYHLAWMYADLGVKVAVADLDPQSKLTSLLLNEDRLEELWPDDEHAHTIRGAIDPILHRSGDVILQHVEDIADNIGLVVGDPGLSFFEETLSAAWWRGFDDESAIRITAAFYQILQQAARAREADLTLVDVGPNLTAINRAALIAADYVVAPLAPGLISLEGLRAMGPAMRDWRNGWGKRREKSSAPSTALPEGRVLSAGYVLMDRVMRFDRPVQAYGRWMSRIPAAYRNAVLDLEEPQAPRIADDPECLGQIRRYFSLMPMALEARKPMFFLKPADGAIGAHAGAVTQCYRDFRALADNIARHIQINIR